MLVSLYMRGQLDTLDAHHEKDEDEDEDVTNSDYKSKTSSKAANGPILPSSDKYYLGARQKKATSLEQIESDHADDIAFKDFRKKLTAHVNAYVNTYNSSSPSNASCIRLTAEHEVSLLLRFIYLTNYLAYRCLNIDF